MKNRINEYRLFLREARESFRTIGAVAPSGRFLARAMVRELRHKTPPRRVLEVGSGTGALTSEIVRHIRGKDELDIVELNAKFIATLQNRFRTEPHFARVASRTRILNVAVQELPADRTYDVVVSGLPLNSFSSEVVKGILKSFNRLIGPGGVLSFFEYLWIREVKGLFAPRHERERLTRVGAVIEQYVARHEFRRDTVLVNLPPALVHHLRFERHEAAVRAGDGRIRAARRVRRSP